MANTKKVLILGGGFGGVKAALELSKSPHFAVTLISDHADFRYYPSLFEAATGRRMAASSIPLAEIFGQRDIKFILGKCEKLNRADKQVVIAGGQRFDYDFLIIALGSVTNFFGIKGLEKNSFGIKSPGNALALRQHIHSQLADGKPDLAYVIIGGGPTGVELAGALPHYLHHVMRAHKLKDAKLHIDLVEGAPRLLPNLSKHYSRAVARRLRSLGVELILGQAVKGASHDSLKLPGHSIKSHTIVWTAGVANNPFLAANKFNLSEHGKVVVNEFLQAEEQIFVIGDNAGTKYSGMAQTALYDAVYISKNLKRLARGKQPRSYKPHRPAYIIPVGPRWAAVQIGRFESFVRLGWLLRAAADFIGYHDFEPWWRAGQHWLGEARSDDDCDICAVK